MEAPAVTASSPISGGSAHHCRHSSSASTAADDEEGVNSKLVIDLDGYRERRGSYSPSEYYCYSVCDASSAADAMQLERTCEGGGNASGPAATTIATTSCVGSVGNGHGATTASLSESIESVVSAAAAFSSSSSAGSTGGGNVLANSESEDGPSTGAHRRPVIADSSLPSDSASRVVRGGRSRASTSTSRPAHDLDSSQKTSPTPGGAVVRRSPTATASSSGESCSGGGGTATAAVVSVRNGAGSGENSRFRQQNNRNVTSVVTLENTCTTKIGGAGDGGLAGALSSPSIFVSLSPPIIATTTATTSSKPSLTVANGTGPVVSNKPRRSAGPSSTKRSKTTNINNTSSASTSGPTVGVSPPGVTKPGVGYGTVNVNNMASNTMAAVAVSSDDQQSDANQQQNPSILSQRQQSNSTPKATLTLPRPSTLSKPKDSPSPSACNSPLGTQQPQDDSASAADASLTLKIKRKKMATRQTAASHEVISDKQRKRENSDETSSSSSSSACASPAPATAANRNSSTPAIAGEKKRKSSSSVSGVRAALANAGAPSSPASSISSTSSASASSFYNHHQQQQHSSSSLSVLSFAGAVSTPSSPPSANANRATPFASAGASTASFSTVTVLPTVSPSTTSAGLGFHMAASDTISNSVNVPGAASTAVGEKGNGKANSKTTRHNFQQETGGMGTPPRKKSKLQATAPNAGIRHTQQRLDQEQEAKCAISSNSPTVFTLRLDTPKEKVEQHDASTWVRTIGTTTETECLGPCEPGTSVTLEGIVWQETAGGILVINVTWRGKTYVGTLLDCTKYDWAPPRHCDSPHSENDSLTSGGGFGASNGNSSGHRTPAKNGNGTGNGSARGRKGGGGNRESKRQQQQQQQQQPQQQQQQTTESATSSSSGSSGSTDQDTTHNGNEASASTSTAQNVTNNVKDTKTTISETILEPHSPIMFECPLGGCEKKFSAVVGVKYHQSSAHRRSCGAALKGKHHHGPCQQTTKNDQPTAEGAASPTAIPAASTRSLLEEAVASTTKLSPEERDSLESLFKVAEQSRLQQEQQESGKPSTRAGSPAYSDISEDETVPPSLTAAATGVTVIHSGHNAEKPTHNAEKPTAIVEPQPLASAIVALSADLASSASPSQQMTGQVGAVCSSSGSALQDSPRGQKRSHSSTSKSPKDSKQSKERQPSSAVVEQNTIRLTPPTVASSTISISPATSRSPEVCQAAKSQPSMLIKAEPGSPRPSSSSVQEFVAPAPPPPPIIQQQLSTGLLLMPHQAVQSQPSPTVASRIPTPSSQLPLPSSASVVQPRSTPSQVSANVPPAPAPPSHHHLNMINQLNHPAFMFNPFNTSSPMFPSGTVPPGMMPPGMGMDPTMAAAAAAALMAAGHPAAAMYAPPGSMAAAALAAAGFQMGLGGGPPGPHPSVGYGFGPPPPSLAVSMAPGILPQSFCPGTNVGPLVTSAQPMHQPPSSPVAPLQSHQLQQQPLHKIHELTEHAKRSTPAEAASTPTPSILVPPSSAVLNGVGSGNNGPQKVSTPCSNSAPAIGLDSLATSSSGSHGKHRPLVTTPKMSSSATIPTTSASSHQSHQSGGGNGSHGHHRPSSANNADSGSQQNKPLSSVPASVSTTVASPDLKTSSLGSLPSVSPPVQRHLHTHHHTHTYPTLLAPAIDPSYAAIVASQQAAAAAAGVVGAFPQFGAPPKS